MARRKKTSPFEDLIDLVAMLPWWACIALAIVRRPENHLANGRSSR